jgi:hypothetical protein
MILDPDRVLTNLYLGLKNLKSKIKYNNHCGLIFYINHYPTGITTTYIPVAINTMAINTLNVTE